MEPLREAIRFPVAVKSAVKREEAPDFPGASSVCVEMEATGGFEPPNRGFADLRLKPLGHVAAQIVSLFC